MSIFAEENKVLFVEGRPGLRATLARLRRGELGRADLQRPCLRQVSEQLFVFRYPVWAPESGHFPLMRLTKRVGQRLIQQALRRLNMAQPIVWLSLPSMVGLVRTIPSACLHVYHVVDEYAAYGHRASEESRPIEELEREMLRAVDVVIVVSKKLYDAKSALHPHTYLVPNGVNYQAYAAALADPDIPVDLQAIKPPRLGYSGLISGKLDFKLLKELALAHPEWSLVFLGEVSRDFKRAPTWQELQRLSNVHYLGSRDVSQVPHYLKGFQVGLMPYLQSRQVDNISPLKLYDYLATGLPLVSVDMPAAHEFKPYIHLADNPQAFADAVRAALADTTPERQQTRRSLAAQHTWRARVEQISDVLRAHLTMKDPDAEASGRQPGP
jgi:glycosyltransferase involved in cell wall biosynthesis